MKIVSNYPLQLKELQDNFTLKHPVTVFLGKAGPKDEDPYSNGLNINSNKAVIKPITLNRLNQEGFNTITIRPLSKYLENSTLSMQSLLQDFNYPFNVVRNGYHLCKVASKESLIKILPSLKETDEIIQEFTVNYQLVVSPWLRGKRVNPTELNASTNGVLYGVKESKKGLVWTSIDDIPFRDQSVAVDTAFNYNLDLCKVTLDKEGNVLCINTDIFFPSFQFGNNIKKVLNYALTVITLSKYEAKFNRPYSIMRTVR